MSIKAMTWAFGLPLEPRAKITLLAIADNARDDGIAWPSKDTVAGKTTQSRATVGRRLKTLEALGVLACFARYREDGTQTTDEIRLNLDVTHDDVMRKLHDAGGANDPESDDDHDGDAEEPRGGGGYQPDTLPSQSCNPTLAVVTGGGLHSGNPQDEPSLEPSKTPPSPPTGGSGPENEISEETKKRFDYFLTNCLGYRTQDPERPLHMFRLLDETEQIACAAASPLHAAECLKAKKKSLDAWKLIRERYWIRYPEARLPQRPADPVWVDEGPDIDALRVLALITDRPPPRLIHDEVKGSGLLRNTAVGADLRALSDLSGDRTDWLIVERDSREYNAWRHRVHEWTAIWLEPQKIWLEPFDPQVHGLPPVHSDFQMRKAAYGLRVPCRWPPKKDGSLYSNEENSDA